MAVWAENTRDRARKQTKPRRDRVLPGKPIPCDTRGLWAMLWAPRGARAASPTVPSEVPRPRASPHLVPTTRAPQEGSIPAAPPPLASPRSYANVYRELEQTIRLSDAQEDLRWFRSTSGPGMPMNWPQFEVRLGTPSPPPEMGTSCPPHGVGVLSVSALCSQEWNPDLTHTITRKEKMKKGEGVTLTNVSSGETGALAGERGR